jgi:hypothetical protein
VGDSDLGAAGFVETRTRRFRLIVCWILRDIARSSSFSFQIFSWLRYGFASRERTASILYFWSALGGREIVGSLKKYFSIHPHRLYVCSIKNFSYFSLSERELAFSWKIKAHDSMEGNNSD